MAKKERDGFDLYDEYLKSFTSKSPVQIVLKLLVIASDILGGIIARLTGEENERALRHASMAMNKITSARGSLARATRATHNKAGPMGLGDFVKPILEQAEGVLEDAIEYQKERDAMVPQAKKKRRAASKVRTTRRTKK